MAGFLSHLAKYEQFYEYQPSRQRKDTTGDSFQEKPKSDVIVIWGTVYASDQAD